MIIKLLHDGISHLGWTRPDPFPVIISTQQDWWKAAIFLWLCFLYQGQQWCARDCDAFCFSFLKKIAEQLTSVEVSLSHIYLSLLPHHTNSLAILLPELIFSKTPCFPIVSVQDTKSSTTSIKAETFPRKDALFLDPSYVLEFPS